MSVSSSGPRGRTGSVVTSWVISADLPRMAHLKAGTRLRFQAVTGAQARQALQSQRADWLRWLATRESFVPAGFIDEAGLYASNLVSGMLRAES